VRRLLDHGHPFDGAEDHGATVSVYLRDPTATASNSTTTGRERSGSTREAPPSSRPKRSTRASYWKIRTTLQGRPFSPRKTTAHRDEEREGPR
jgi:hypothetical protein